MESQLLERRPISTEIRLGGGQDEVCVFMAPRCFQACKAVTLKGAPNTEVQDEGGLARGSHLSSVHALAPQLKRILLDGVSASRAALEAAGGVLNQCEVSQSFDEAPHVPIAGATQAAARNERIQA